jgi:hypothetical protein
MELRCMFLLLLLLLAGDGGDIPEQLRQYVDGSAQLPVKTYFLGGYGEQKAAAAASAAAASS